MLLLEDRQDLFGVLMGLHLGKDVQQALGSLLGDQNELTQASEAVMWAQSRCLKHRLLCCCWLLFPAAAACCSLRLPLLLLLLLCLLVAVPCCCRLHSSLAAAVCSQLLMGLLSTEADLS